MRKTSKAFIFGLLTALILYGHYPLLEHGVYSIHFSENAGLHLPHKVLYPFDYNSNIWLYSIIYLILSALLVFRAIMNACVDIFYFSSTQYCAYLFQLVGLKIRLLFKKSEEEKWIDKRIKKELSELIELHNDVFEVVKLLDHLICIQLLVAFSLQSIAICTNGFAAVSI